MAAMSKAMFGLEPDPTPVETPAPTSAPKVRKTAPPAQLAPAPEQVAVAQAEQARYLANRAQELADLAERVTRAGTLQGPAATDDVVVTPAEHVIERWNRYNTPDGVAKLGLPVGSRLNAVPVGLGVEVRVKVPAGTVLTTVARAVVELAKSWEWGAYVAAPHDSSSFTLTREIVGTNPAAAWNDAGHTVGAMYAAKPRGIRQKVWEMAGLTVKKPDGTFLYPEWLEAVIGPRGPEIVIDPPPGISTDSAIKVAPQLRRLLRCPDLEMIAEGVRVRIELRTKPALTFPKVVTLEPSQFHLPVTPEQRFLAAPKLTLPVGVTAAGEPILVNLANRPHTVIAGTSGSGKSRTLLSMITGLCLGGAAVAIGDFKGDPDLAFLSKSGMPGVVHYSTTLAGISRLVMWMRDELEERKALLPLLATKGITRPVFEPVVCVIDEWGQGLDELENSPDPAERGAAAAIVNSMSKIFAQGRSFSLHVILSTQHTYTSSIPGRISQNAANRIIIGKPKAGAAGPIEVLFKDSKDEAKTAADGIVDGVRGRGIIADQAGKIVQFQAVYGYTPAEAPETASDSELAASWARTRDALLRTPRLRRWSWKFPTDGSGEWQSWSLFPGDKTTGPLPTVAQLDVVALDGIDGRPDPAAAIWDWNSPHYAPGTPPLNTGHRAPMSY